jgi:hypothetical protein
MACLSPVAFFIFNRPDLTRRVFAAIREARPKQLLVIADGPRHSEEAMKCCETREIIHQVDWDCDVHTDFAAENLGCGRRLASGLDWVFARVEQAIILEDDCLPARSFFFFCEQLLEHYRADTRVMHISGTNLQPRPKPGDWSYYFSKYANVWGWATWRRAWQAYDFEIKSWGDFKASGMLHSICPDPIEAEKWQNKLDPIFEGQRQDTWDYQWTYALWSQGGRAVVPRVNLVSNLGFRSDGTHTRRLAVWGDLPLGAIERVVHPPFVVPDREADSLAFDELYGGKRRRLHRTWRYRLAKPVRLLKKLCGCSGSPGTDKDSAG